MSVKYITTEELISLIKDSKAYGLRQAKKLKTKKVLVLDSYYTSFKDLFENFEVLLYDSISIKKASNLKGRNHKINVISL